MPNEDSKGRPPAPRNRPVRDAGDGRTSSGKAASAGSSRTARKTTRRAMADGARTTRKASGRTGAGSAAELRRSARAAAGAADEHRGVHVGGIDVSMRALGFLLLVGLIGVLLVPTLYDWARQEQDYRAIQQRVEAARERNADMQRELDLWSDPDFIAQQARTRLGYLKPGETQYAVVDPGDDAQSSVVSSVDDAGPKRPWVLVIGESITQADQATTVTPVPGDTGERPQSSDQGQSQN